MARQKRSRELTKDDWDEAIDAVRLFSNLERPEFRKKVRELARELEREGLAAHRAADRLEGLTKSVAKGARRPTTRGARSWPVRHRRVLRLPRDRAKLEAKLRRVVEQALLARHSIPVTRQ